MLFVASQDAQSIAQLADGDDALLGELFDSYAPSVLALLQAMLGPSHEAEEQLHELFLELWTSAPSWDVRTPQPLRTWLLLRARQRALALLSQQPELASFGEEARLLPRGWRPPGRYDASWMEDPHFGRDRLRLRRALLALGPRTRSWVAKSYLRGVTPRELAREHAQPTRRAARRLAFAYRTLREHAHDDGKPRPCQ